MLPEALDFCFCSRYTCIRFFCFSWKKGMTLEGAYRFWENVLKKPFHEPLFLSIPFSIFCVSRATKTNMWRQISRKQLDLKKKLKVTFSGEPGLDMGGLTKEWFSLLIRQIFHEDYGMYAHTNWCNIIIEGRRRYFCITHPLPDDVPRNRIGETD